MRFKAPVLPALATVTQLEWATLRAQGAAIKGYWGAPPPSDALFYSRFKHEVKEYYYFQQARRCCYCSEPLKYDHSQFDAEHVLDQSTYGQFMFELNNLAAACKDCNRFKGTQSALTNPGPQLTTVPTASTDYCIVHPHLDDWDAHLRFDEFERVLPVPGSTKGKETFRICQFRSLNNLKLSDHFSPGHSKAAYQHIHNFTRYKQQKRKQDSLALLKQLAVMTGLAKAAAVIARIEGE